MGRKSGLFARLLIVGACLAGIAACGVVPDPDDASIERVQAAAYAPSGPSKLTLITVVNNNTGAGGHTALVVSASQQVIFDPAGSFRDERIPRRKDVIYGVTPAWLQAYKSAHARSTYHVVSQEIVVPPEVAEKVLRLVVQNGAVGDAFCTNATSGILRQLPGFGEISVTFYPVKLQNQFETLPGVTTDKYYENDEGGVADGIAAAQL